MTMIEAPRDRALAQRRARDRRIRQLADDGWSLKRIAGEVGVTDERVRQILASSPSQEETIAATIRELRIELAYVTTSAELTATVAHVTLSARAKALSRQLVRLEEELEAHRIDRLLGLA